MRLWSILRTKPFCIRRVEPFDAPDGHWKVCGRIASHGVQQLSKTADGQTWECLVPLCKEHAPNPVGGPTKAEPATLTGLGHLHIGIHANIGFGCCDVIFQPLPIATWAFWGHYPGRPNAFFLGPLYIEVKAT